MEETYIHQPKKILKAIIETMESHENRIISDKDYAKAITNELADQPEKANFEIELLSPRYFRITPKNVYSAVLIYHDRTYEQVGDGDHHEEAYDHQDAGTFLIDDDGDPVFIRDRDEAMYPCYTEIKL